MRNSISLCVRRASSRPPRARRLFHVPEQPHQLFQLSSRHYATALPITATGPPPDPPVPAPSEYGERIDRRRRQAEMLRQSQELRAKQKPGSRTNPLRKRFWNEVHVKQTPEGYQILLDARPVRTPNKTILTVPLSKSHLAHAIAIEWDMLVSAQQALKNHNIPLTSIASRAQDLIESENKGETKTREDITSIMLRYLDTDTLLCWAPERNLHDPSSTTSSSILEHTPSNSDSHATAPPTLRAKQTATALPIIQYLQTYIWPGVTLRPVLESDSILPTPQDEPTRSIIQGWIAGLPAYELAALERAALAGKSLLVAARLIVEWSEHFRDLPPRLSMSTPPTPKHNNSNNTAASSSMPSSSFSSTTGAAEKVEESRFGIETASGAASLEVAWQTRVWGEVEDTHDVEHEDIRRQMGQAVLMVVGVGDGDGNADGNAR